MTLRKKNKSILGFTLVELMIAVVILGILSVIGIGSFTSTQLKARDSKRKRDLAAISSALETYYNDYGTYPDNNDNGEIMGCGDQEACEWGESWQDQNGTVYMVQMPKDPNSEFTYSYFADSTGKYYRIFARLENRLDPSIPKIEGKGGNTNAIYSEASGTKGCNNYGCNYGVTSTNTNLGGTEEDPNSGSEDGGVGTIEVPI